MFEEDYTEEELARLQERQDRDKKYRQKNIDIARKDSSKERIRKWREKNREKIRAYNTALKKRLRAERGLPQISPEAMRRQTIKDFIKRGKNYPERGRMTEAKLLDLYHELEQFIAENYIEKNMNGNRKHIILCIVGPSGAGKTLASLHLENKFGANTICSFTTRPPRLTEVEGRDHHFVDIVPEKEELLAYTVYGGHKYYALKVQVHGPVTIYVVDENGLLELKEKFASEYDIYSMFIDRKAIYRKVAGVTQNRMERDKERAKTIPLEDYDYHIVNDGTKVEFFKQIDKIYNDLVEEAKKYGWE